jgi:hypothetical protein
MEHNSFFFYISNIYEFNIGVGYPELSNLSFIQSLLNNGADASSKDNNGRGVLSYVNSYVQEDVKSLLKRYGAAL